MINLNAEFGTTFPESFVLGAITTILALLKKMENLKNHQISSRIPYLPSSCTAQKMKFSIKYLFS